MKIKTWVLATLLALSPLTVHAGLLTGDAQIQKIIRLEPGACSIEIGLLEDVGLLDLQDRVNLGDNLLARLGSILDLLNLDLLPGDSILLASESFEDLTGITADIELDDADCDGLSPNATLEILNALNVVVDTAILDPDFDDNYALVRVGAGSEDFELVSLGEAAVLVTNTSGEATEKSSEDVAAENSGTNSGVGAGATTDNPTDVNLAAGCSMGNQVSFSGPYLAMASLMLLLGLIGRRSLLRRKN